MLKKKHERLQKKRKCEVEIVSFVIHFFFLYPVRLQTKMSCLYFMTLIHRLNPVLPLTNKKIVFFFNLIL